MQHSSEVAELCEVDGNGAPESSTMETSQAFSGDPTCASNNVKVGRSMKRGQVLGDQGSWVVAQRRENNALKSRS